MYLKQTVIKFLSKIKLFLYPVKGYYHRRKINVIYQISNKYSSF